MLRFLFSSVKKTAILSLCTCIILTDALGQISIAKWKGDKEAALSIGSDDGMIRSIKSSWTLNNPNVPYDGYYTLAKEYQVNMTFFIDGRQIDDPTFAPFSSYKPITQPPGSSGTWSDWKFMHDAGHEIASHSYSHANFKSGECPSISEIKYEIIQNNTQIAKNIGETPVSFNMPFTGAYSIVWPIVRDYYPIVANDVWKEKGHSYFDITEKTKKGELETMLRTALKNGNWMTAVGHGIRTNLGRIEESSTNFITNGSRWDGFSPVQYEVLDAFFQFASSRKDSLFIGTFKDVGLYKIERDSSRVTIVSHTASEIIVNVSHTLKPAYRYTYPLTLKIPNRQYKIENVAQEGVYLTIGLDDGFYLIDIVPNRGDIVIALDIID